METMIFIGVLLFVYVYAIRIDSKRVRPLEFMRIPVAHRGLYTKDQRIPENSLAAFQRAVDHQVAIELDVQCSADLVPFVFHDDGLKRMCGVGGILETMKSEEIKPLRLRESEETIPTFAEVLKLVDGKVPLWIEIKTTKRVSLVVERIVGLLEEYHGDYSICSFDPYVLYELKKKHPAILRGIIVEYAMKNKKIKFKNRVILSLSLMNFLIRPDYQSYDVRYRYCPTYQVNRLSGAFSAVWAIGSKSRQEKIKKQCDTVIFEHYLP
jgi:glycerophosphoryl diester phosphodiesterase